MSAPVVPGMDRVGLLGVSWRNATAATLAQFTLPRESRDAELKALAATLEVDELLYVATCNRVEVLYAGGAMISTCQRRRRLHAHFTDRKYRPVFLTGSVERTLRAWEGEGAIEHLYLVACGLDSARTGESEIAGQLRAAVGDAERLGLCGPVLRALLDDAFRVAKRVRPVTEGRIGRASLADLAAERIGKRLAAQPGAVALVGVSAMTERCAASLARAGVPLVIVNRTVRRARELAETAAKNNVAGSHGVATATLAQPGDSARAEIAVRSLDEFRAAPDSVTALMVATGSAEPVFDLDALQRLALCGAGGVPPLVVDLAVPANVRAADAERVGIERVGMDAITEMAESGRARALAELGEARAMVDAALEARRRRAWEAMVDPVIVELRRRLEARARGEVECVLQGELASLDAAERAALRRWTETLVHRLAHVPTRGLRDLAGRAGPDAAAAFLGTSAPDLAAELRARAGSVGANPAAGDVPWDDEVTR